MEFNDFCEKVKRHVANHYGDEKAVTLKPVMKNNGITLTGLVVTDREINISPTVYLNSFYMAYEDGETMASVVEKVVKAVDSGSARVNIDIESFSDFARAKDHIVYKLIGKDANSELLERVPHVSFCDMEIVFLFLVNEMIGGNGSVLINNEHMERWGTDRDTLMELARKNTPKLLPACIHRMDDLIREMFMEKLRAMYAADHIIPGMDTGEDPEAAMERLADQVLGNVTEHCSCLPMFVVSNSIKYFGAACMLYDSLLAELAKRIGAGYYILPSSVHEFIAVDERGCNDAEELANMVKEVNRTQVPPDEILTDSVYHYDREKNEMTLVMVKSVACAGAFS